MHLAITLKPFDMEPEEAAGIGVLALMEAAQTYDPAHGANLGTWSRYRVMRHMKNARRESNRNPQMTPLVFEDDEFFTDVAAEEPDPLESPDDLGKLAAKLFAELPERTQYVIQRRLGLKDGEPIGPADMGLELGISRQTVDGIFKSGIRTLRKQLTESKVRCEKKHLTWAEALLLSNTSSK